MNAPLSPAALVLQKEIVVALVGNPNCGKTSLFNQLTGARQRVGNFGGVTVTRKEGLVRHRGRLLRLVDLPGIYALSSASLEEVVSRRYILEEAPDVILNVLDAGNLERNLFLTTQLIEMARPAVTCLNMMDEAHAKGLDIDLSTFATLLGSPAVATVARVGQGLTELLDAVVAVADGQYPVKPVRMPCDSHLEEAVATLTRSAGMSRWQAVKLLEGDGEAAGDGVPPVALQQAADLRQHLAISHGQSVENMLTVSRYGFIRGLLRETVRTMPDHPVTDSTSRVDNVLLHRGWGLPLFFLFMWMMFEATFTLGKWPADGIETGVAALAAWVGDFLPVGALRELVTEGLFGGIGGVLVFLPNIMLLFLFIALFEDTGYMARVAFLMDRFMHGVGLHGKAFIPMLMGFGCNVPAIMAVRTLESPRDRLVTILINPFMSCSARLPVLVLFAAAFFPQSAGTVVFGMYLLGLATALAGALLLRHTLFRGGSEPFVMELPPYRLPTPRSVLLHMWDRAVRFLQKISGVILVGSILIWYLQAFPRAIPLPADWPAELDQAYYLQENRYLGQFGKTIAPVFESLGFGWRESVALLSGFVAKEVVVSTLGVLHHQGQKEDETSTGLRDALAQTMTPASGLAFMVFTLLYTPCLSTIAVIRRETNSWGWTGFSVLFSLLTAWTLALLAYWGMS